MKKPLLTFLSLLFITSLLIAQVPEGTILRFGFYKVEEGKQAEYETVMKDYLGELMKERIENGCMENWIFRRVLPYTNASNYFTHITIDVLKPGKTNYQCEGVTKETVFPEMSEGMHELLLNVHRSSRKVVYRTVVSYVAGFNKNDEIVKYAAYNFIRTLPGKGVDYRNMHKEYQKSIYEKYSNQSAWHAFFRSDPAVGGSNEWNYLTVDGYDTMDQKRNRSVNVPEDIAKERNKKYGNYVEMRDLKYQVVAELIMSAKE